MAHLTPFEHIITSRLLFLSLIPGTFVLYSLYIRSCRVFFLSILQGQQYMLLFKQADHLRQETLQQMHRILTPRQAAKGLLAMGEYFHRLRALSNLWATRPREPA